MPVRSRKPPVRMSFTGYSSRRYGPCEVCHEHATEVWIGVDETRLSPSGSWTWIFGHRECMAKSLPNAEVL